MSRFSVFALAVLFSFLSTLPASAQNPSAPVVEGTLVGHDGTPVQQAHVRVEAPDLAKNVKLRTEAAAENGSFRVPIDTTGIVRLRFTGTNHRAEQVVTYAEPEKTIALDVRLGLHNDSFSSLRLIGGFNNFSMRKGARPMTEQSDGTFAATVPAPGDSLVYQVLGASRDFRGFPIGIQGTQEDAVAFDGRGYRSIVHAPKDSVRIRFDPDKLLRGDAESRIQFRDSTTTAARYADFMSDLKERVLAFQGETRKAKSDSARQVVRDTFDWSPSRDRFRDALLQDAPEPVMNAFRVGYVVAGGMLDSTVVQEILNEVRPSSPEWALSMYGYAPGRGPISRAIQETGKPEAYLSYAYEALRTQSHDALKADLLIFLLRQAKENGNATRQHTLYTWLQAEYGDTFAARIAARKLDPSKGVQPGQSVPDFAVQGLQDSTRTFTPGDFEGQYLLLDFWATWCGPCLDAIPTLRKAHEAHGDALTILSISVDRERSTVTDFLSDRDLPWRHAYTGGGLANPNEFVQQFQVAGLPTYVLIGPDGKIVTKKMPHEGDPLPKILDHVSSSGAAADAPSDASGSSE